MAAWPTPGKFGVVVFETNWIWPLELTPDGFKTRTVDFGDGTLDDKATFTVDGQTISFTMQ